MTHFILSCNLSEKLVMVIGGWNDDGLTDDIELVSLDSNPVPDCLSNLMPFPYGAIYESAGAAMTSGMKDGEGPKKACICC